MSEINPYVPPEAAITAQKSPRHPYDPRYDGLGGWLILIGIGVIASPFMLVRHLINFKKSIFDNGTWEALTTASSDAYHPLWAPLLCVEAGFNLISLVIAIVMVPMYFSKKKFFPQWFVWLHVVTLVFIVADAFALLLVRPDLSAIDPESAKEISRSVVGVCIWVPYMIYSKRVASTFTR